jgi:imidazole glycerol-phosphate synthase subunit HisH
MGNLRSVSKALEHLGGKVKVSSDPQDLKSADKVVLPGVGAFGDAMHELRRQNLVEPIREAVAHKKPFLGICLGMQLLFKTSEESPGAEGLDILPGYVQRFRSKQVKIPQMGWNQIALKKESALTRGLADNSYFYFVHSFYIVPEDKSLTLGETQYGDEKFTSILASDTVFATQFHPEKSQSAGLAILKNFIEI